MSFSSSASFQLRNVSKISCQAPSSDLGGGLYESRDQTAYLDRWMDRLCSDAAIKNTCVSDAYIKLSSLLYRIFKDSLSENTRHPFSASSVCFRGNGRQMKWLFPWKQLTMVTAVSVVLCVRTAASGARLTARHSEAGFRSSSAGSLC